MNAKEILGFNPKEFLKYTEGECINYDNTEIDEIDVKELIKEFEEYHKMYEKYHKIYKKYHINNCLKSKQFKNWYEFRDAVEASIESRKDTYIYAVDDTPEMSSEWTYRLIDCNEANVFCVSKTFNMEDFQKYLFIKYNVAKKCDDLNIIIDWINDDGLIYKRLFIFRLNRK